MAGIVNVVQSPMVLEVMDPREDHTTVYLLKNYIAKNIYA